MATLPMRRSQVKVLDLWNGSSNDAPPTDYYTRAFDDSAWVTAATPSDVSGSNAMRRFTLDTPASSATLVTPALNAGAERAWPTTTAVSTSQQAILRWHFNPGPGPFTGAELLLLGGNNNALVTLALNVDDIDDLASMSYNQAGNSLVNTTGVVGTTLHTWAGDLVPSADNVLVAYIQPFTPWVSGIAWFSMAWNFPAGDHANYLQLPVRASMVRVQRLPANSGHEADFPGWTDPSYDDSGWPIATFVTDHPALSETDLDNQWNYVVDQGFLPGAGAPTWRPDPLWAIDHEAEEGAGSIFRIRFTIPPGEIVRTPYTDFSGDVLLDGTYYLVNDSIPPLEPFMWVNGTFVFTPSHVFTDFAEALIAGQENVIALQLYNAGTFFHPIAEGYGAWVEFYIQVAYSSAIQPVQRGRGRRSFVQVIG